MPADAEIYKLNATSLHALRGAACEELVVAVRRGAPAYTLREFVQVVDEVDRRLDQRASAAEQLAESRQRVAATRSATSRVAGRGRG
jgi:hypothetical protein